MDEELEAETAPWDEDPVNRLPKVVEPGRIDVLLWSSVGSEEPTAHDVRFTWRGGREADWYEDISMENDGLSVMSSAPFSGALTWENGEDLHVIYRSSDFGIDGEQVLPGAAPVAGGRNLADPHVWVGLAEEMLGLVFSLIN